MLNRSMISIHGLHYPTQAHHHQSGLMNHPPLQYYLMSSKPGDCPQDNGDTSQRDVQFDQSPHGTAFLRREKRDSEFRIVPKTRTFLSPSKPERIISRKTLCS